MFRTETWMSAAVLCLVMTTGAAAQTQPSEPAKGAGSLETVKRIHAPIEVTVLPSPSGG